MAETCNTMRRTRIYVSEVSTFIPEVDIFLPTEVCEMKDELIRKVKAAGGFLVNDNSEMILLLLIVLTILSQLFDMGISSIWMMEKQGL